MVRYQILRDSGYGSHVYAQGAEKDRIRGSGEIRSEIKVHEITPSFVFSSSHQEPKELIFLIWTDAIVLV